MVKPTNSSQTTESATAIIRSVPIPIQTKFCRTMQEFHDERGLSMEGVDPRSLHGDTDILDKEWNSVFTCPKPGGPGNAKKVKAYHVRAEFAHALVHRHWDVYQEGPFMYEIGHQFAKGFALENCAGARTSEAKDLYTIDWAHFAERAMKNSEDRHHLANKRRRWEEQMRARSSVTDADCGPFGKSEFGRDFKDVFSMHLEQAHFNEISSMKAGVQERVTTAKGLLHGAKAMLETAIAKLHRAEGAQCHKSFLSQFQGEINSLSSEFDRERLLKLMGSFQGPDEEDIQQLQEKVEEAKVCSYSPL